MIHAVPYRESNSVIVSLILDLKLAKVKDKPILNQKPPEPGMLSTKPRFCLVKMWQKDGWCMTAAYWNVPISERKSFWKRFISCVSIALRADLALPVRMDLLYLWCGSPRIRWGMPSSLRSWNRCRNSCKRKSTANLPDVFPLMVLPRYLFILFSRRPKPVAGVKFSYHSLLDTLTCGPVGSQINLSSKFQESPHFIVYKLWPAWPITVNHMTSVPRV